MGNASALSHGSSALKTSRPRVQKTERKSFVDNDQIVQLIYLSPLLVSVVLQTSGHPNLYTRIQPKQILGTNISSAHQAVLVTAQVLDDWVNLTK